MQEAAKPAQHLSLGCFTKIHNRYRERVNVTNIKLIVPELFTGNLIQGVFARSVTKAQAHGQAAPTSF